MIRTIWIEELEAPEREQHKIKPDSDFLSIGGDSMRFVRVCARLEETFTVEIGENDMADIRTITTQCAYIASALKTLPHRD